ncbi:hypothetical protein HXX76_007088 [Chlamydomonas incerta]|uniref:Holocytochrome c-type synthase n=1 Tax=Chlamydomonas incerta TaxID=51695 RepID=A0A835SZ84_CHLIN|nr:hypothetical protein HXX76_007088 [Chlamydomonas incerta]|eukprot:KAG2435893.1 hypothetical protein HXX76_007088 [Chlamydomonas incerta]
MVEGSAAGGSAERSSRLFAKYASIISAGPAASEGVECGASGAAGSTSGTATRPQQTPSSCSYAAAAGASPLPPTSGACPVASTPSSSTATTTTSTSTRTSCSAAAAVADGGTLNPLNNIPSALAAAPAPVPGLGGQRMVSSIPMAPPDKLPPHQAPGQQNWVYPSEQMFYNAMKRKGWDPQADDMRSVVHIHNNVNEQAWHQVLAWERLHCDECATPRLKRFQGRPSDLSPKARLLNFVGFGLPFDRHDWVVDRCGKEVRYVIDFYNGAPQPGAPATPAAFFLDVRPALDSVGAAWDRLRMQFSWVASGRWRD